VDGVSQRIEDRRGIAIDPRIVVPNIGHRQGNVFGEGTGAIDTDTGRVFAEMASAGQAVTASSAHDVPFTRDDLAGKEILYVGADFDDFTNELMTDNHWNGNRFLSPRVPIVDVKVSPADSRFFDSDQTVVDTDFGEWNILELETDTAMMFDQSFHGLQTEKGRDGTADANGVMRSIRFKHNAQDNVQDKVWSWNRRFHLRSLMVVGSIWIGCAFLGFIFGVFRWLREICWQ